MRRWPIATALLSAGLVFAVGTFTAAAQQRENQDEGRQAGKTAPAGPKAERGELKPQAVCPIMGGKISRKVFTDVAGYRIYACCRACLAKIEADPEKAVATLRAKGQTPELRLVVCPQCGEIKGTAQCCRAEAAKCPKCRLNKGSIGCCKDLKPAGERQDVVLCPKCGEVKGAPKCCQPEAPKCSKCGRNKGAPGCCKDLKPAGDTQSVVICPKCGEVQRAAECCQPNAPKCPKCGLNKGAPGCCKIDRFMTNKD